MSSSPIPPSSSSRSSSCPSSASCPPPPPRPPRRSRRRSRRFRKPTGPGWRRSRSSSPTRSGRRSWRSPRTISGTPSSSSSGPCGTPVKRTARNEFRDAWESNLQQAKAMFGDVKDGRTRALLLNGLPDGAGGVELLADPRPHRGLVLRADPALPASRSSSSSTASGRPDRSASGIPTRGSTCCSPARADRSAPSTRSARSPAPATIGCGDDEHARRMLAGIAWVLSQARDWIYIQALVDEPPKPPGGEWVSAFNSYSTDVPAGAGAADGEARPRLPRPPAEPHGDAGGGHRAARRRRPGAPRRGAHLQPPAQRRGAGERRAARQLPLQVRPRRQPTLRRRSLSPSSAPCGPGTTR